MNTRVLSLLLFVPLFLGGWALPRAAAQLSSLRVTATRTVLLADGKQSTDIIAEVRDSEGRPAPTGTTVLFSLIGSGTLAAQTVPTFAGTARVRLTSAPVAGTARVTAITAGGGAASIDIVYTDDPEALFEGNLYMQVTGTSYLAYSANDRVIEAQGKNAGARLTFRNIELKADRLQLDCAEYILRAHNNVTLKRGPKAITATRLYYSLQSGIGYAISELDGKLQPVIINGESLRMEPSPAPIPASYIQFPELQLKLLITAQSITYFPGERLQFRRPRFYQNQAQIMTLPYYELPLYSEELFTDQFISVGTNGFGLELPVYYNMTPQSQGAVVLRHQQQSGRSFFSTTPGWAVDVVQSYSTFGSRRSEGSFGFTGLLNRGWGFRWNHNQEINSQTQGTFLLDFPQHQGVLGSVNLTQQGRKLRWGANLAAGRTFAGASESNLRSDLFLETQPERIGRSKDWMYTFGTTVTTSYLDSQRFGVGNISETAQSLTMRAFSRPLSFGSRTTLNTSFTLGHTWIYSGNSASGLTALATLALDHNLGKAGALNLTYDLIEQPGVYYLGNGKHRMSLTYAVAASKRLQASVFGSAFLDTQDATLWGDLSYGFAKDWRLITSLTYQKYAGANFQDVQFTIGRRFGARELQLTYSTYLKRLSIDFTATRFN